MFVIIGFLLACSVVIIICGKAQEEKANEDPPYESIKGNISDLEIETDLENYTTKPPCFRHR